MIVLRLPAKQEAEPIQVDGRESALTIRQAGANTFEVSGDILGCHRVYYKHEADRLLITDDLSALISRSGDLSMDAGVLRFFLQTGLTPQARTPFREIRKVPVGHVLRVNVSNLSTTTVRMSCFDDLRNDPDARVEQVIDAVAETTADTCDAVALSGGMDSSFLLALAARRRRSDLASIACETEGRADEAAWRRLASDRSGSPLFEYRVPLTHYQALLDSAIKQLPDPVGGHIIASYAGLQVLAERLSIRDITFGDGAEEVLDRETHQVRLDDRGRLQPSQICFDASQAADLLVESTAATPAADLEHEQHTAVNGLADTAHPIFLNNLFFHLSGFSLYPQTQIAKARGIVLRWPFLAWPALLPNLTNRQLVSPDNGKQALRSAARGLVPDSIIDRPKVGRSSGFAAWIRTPAGRRAFLDLTTTCDLYSARGKSIIEDLLVAHGNATGKAFARPLSCAYILATWRIHWGLPTQ